MSLLNPHGRPTGYVLGVVALWLNTIVAFVLLQRILGWSWFVLVPIGVITGIAIMLLRA